MSEDRLEPEVQIASASAHEPAGETVVGRDDMLEATTGDSRLSPEVQELIERCLSGLEPLGRDLKAWEVLKFNPNHVNMCVLRASGFKNQEIAQILNEHPGHISQILCHPYGIKLVKALTVRSSTKVFDIRTRMEDFAFDLLERTYGMAMTDDKLETVADVTFKMLDRTGHGPVQASSSSKAPEGLTTSESTMKRLYRAIEGSDQIRREVMPTWVPRRPPDEGSLPALSAGGVVGAEEDAREENSQQAAAGGQR